MSTSLFSLAGKRALITGSSQGLGLAIARALAAAGASIVVNGRTADKLSKLVQTLKSEGLNADFEAFDVTDEASPSVRRGWLQSISRLGSNQHTRQQRRDSKAQSPCRHEA